MSVIDLRPTPTQKPNHLASGEYPPVGIVCKDQDGRDLLVQLAATAHVEVAFVASDADQLASRLEHRADEIDGLMTFVTPDQEVADIAEVVEDADIGVPSVLVDLPDFAGPRLQVSAEVAAGFSEVITQRGGHPAHDALLALNSLHKAVTGTI